MNVELEPVNGADSLGKVVLVFPRFHAPQYPVWLPMEVMTLATSLSNAGYRVRILDERMEPRAEEILLREAGDALFVGISARPGDQVYRALDLFAKVKEKHPDTVTVFGGWFPSNFTRDCLDIETIDVAVKGAGDSLIVEVADRLSRGLDLKGVAGVACKLNGALIENPRRPIENMDDTPRVEYEKFPIERYVTHDGAISYYSSRGCPASCRFCCVQVSYPNEWSGYSAGRVLDEMEFLVKRYGVKIFKIHDTNFCPDLDRVKEVCRGIIERGLDVRWIVDLRVADILGFDEETWDLLRRSGCRELETGGEAGCDKQLESVAKECTSGDIQRAAELAVGHGIPIRINFIVGLHGEGRREMMATLRLLHRVQSLGDGVRLQFYRYTPVPTTSLGMETWQQVRRGNEGVVPSGFYSILDIPINFEEAHMFWLSKAQEKRAKRLYYFYLPIVYYYAYIRDRGKSRFRRWVLDRFIDVSRIRLRFGILAFPFEQWICKRMGRTMPRTREFEWESSVY